jgi:DUF971 family protein/molybdopterin converting factor small subunit
MSARREGEDASAQATRPAATRLTLDAGRGVLRVEFEGGVCFDLDAEYLRTFSPTPESRGAVARGEPVLRSPGVAITGVTPAGRYAVCIAFDDGHDTGVYALDTLYDLGRDEERNWAEYRARLARAGEDRPATWETPAEEDWVDVRVLYFADLVDRLGRASEEITTPEGVATVGALIAWLRERGGEWARALAPGRIRVAVNQRFAVAETRLRTGDEVAVTPVGR